MAVPALRRLVQEEGDRACALFDGDDVYERQVRDIAGDLLASADAPPAEAGDAV
jgi:hypothetical protein